MPTSRALRYILEDDFEDLKDQILDPDIPPDLAEIVYELKSCGFVVKGVTPPGANSAVAQVQLRRTIERRGLVRIDNIDLAARPLPSRRFRVFGASSLYDVDTGVLLAEKVMHDVYPGSLAADRIVGMLFSTLRRTGAGSWRRAHASWDGEVI